MSFQSSLPQAKAECRHQSLETPSVFSPERPITLPLFAQAKLKQEKITCLTAYDYTTALLLDEAGVEMLLVGDSLAMTMLGHPDTLSITVDEMLHHVKAVRKGTRRAFVIADMPFMSYQVDFASAVRHAGRFIQEGRAQAVKLEGASRLVLEVIAHLTQIGIPVMGHLGLTPQSVNTLGGFRLQAKTVETAQKLMDDAKALEAAGVFSLVLEMVPVEVAQWVSEALHIPTIGIGAGAGCDGQVLVIDDVLGRYPHLSPRFVRQYMKGQQVIGEAVRQYVADVKAGTFPDNTTEAYAFPEKDMVALTTLQHP